MNRITFLLKLQMQGPAVGDLQDALQLCLDRVAILANDEGARSAEITDMYNEGLSPVPGRKIGEVY